MKPNNKLFVFLIVSIINIFLISECAKIERELDFKTSGLIGIKESVAMQEDLIKLSYNSVDEFYANIDSQFSTGYYLNFKVSKLKTKIKDADAYGYTIEGTTSENIAELLLSSDKLKVDIDWTGIVKKDIKITITSTKNNNQNNHTTSSDDIFGNLSDSITDTVVNSISDKFVIRVPGKVLSSNGYVDENDPNLLTWDISDVEMGDVPSKELTVSYLNTELIFSLFCGVLIGTVLIISFIFLVIFITKKVVKHADNNTDALKSYLRKFENDGGKVVYDVYIPGINNLVGHVDAVLIHDSGIYLFDKRKYEGWISGNDSDENWTFTSKSEEQDIFLNPIKQSQAQISWMKKNMNYIVEAYSVIIFPEQSNLISVSNSISNVKVIRGNDYRGIVESFKVTRGVIFESEIEELYNEIKKFTKM